MHLKLYEVPIGTILKIEFLVSGKKFCFDIKIKDVKGTKVFTDVISVDDKVLGFNSGTVKPDLILYRKDKKPVVWKEVPLTHVKVRGSDFYLIKLEQSGLEVNRRNCFRIPIGLDGKVRVGLNKTVINTTIKDISESGISVIMDELYGDLDKKNIHVAFKDNELKYDFSLAAKIVRKETSPSRKSSSPYAV